LLQICIPLLFQLSLGLYGWVFDVLQHSLGLFLGEVFLSLNIQTLIDSSLGSCCFFDLVQIGSSTVRPYLLQGGLLEGVLKLELSAILVLLLLLVSLLPNLERGGGEFLLPLLQQLRLGLAL
jgi:hypothetical protein